MVDAGWLIKEIAKREAEANEQGQNSIIDSDSDPNDDEHLRTSAEVSTCMSRSDRRLEAAWRNEARLL